MFSLLVLLPSIAFACQSFPGSQGISNKLTVDISQISAIPLEYVVNRDNNQGYITAVSDSDANLKIKNSILSLLYLAFGDIYHGTYGANFLSFDILSPTYKPLQCDALYPASTPGFVPANITAATNGLVCFVANDQRSVIRTCPFAMNASTCAYNVSRSDFYDADRFKEQIVMSMPNTAPEANGNMRMIQSELYKNKDAIEKIMNAKLKSHCYNAFKDAHVQLDTSN